MEEAHITCPDCGHSTEQEMPRDRSVVLLECPNCHTRIKAKEGKCCVFCSYSDKHCPACTCDIVGNQGSQGLPSNPS